MVEFDPNILVQHLLDRFSLGLLFLVTVLILLVLIEVGFRLGRRQQKNPAKAQHSQVRAIMAATLGLLAFMLAFSFATAQGHFEARVQNMVEETRLAGNAFLQAEFLEEPYRSRARQIMYEYVSDRIRVHDLAAAGQTVDLAALMRKAETLQSELWSIAVEHEKLRLASGQNANRQDGFLDAIVGVIDIHTLRLQTAFMNRISWVIWATLYLTALLSMLVMGYQAGLVKKRSPLATVTLTVSFAAVMMLITDLDRPFMSLFQIDNRIMMELAERMASML